MRALAEMMSQVPMDRIVAETRPDILLHLAAALLFGGAIGLERSYHGRPAGFRTHALVCLASAFLMLVTVHVTRWLPAAAGDTFRMDPTRMAQGIMTGIGFLGAGVIFKEGLTVRGLTTAASIWTTAGIGILMGAGLYGAGALATVLTVGVLSTFRSIETRFPNQIYARHVVRFARTDVMPEPTLRALLAEHGFKVTEMGYALLDGENAFEYRMGIRTRRPENMGRLAVTLGARPQVRAFTLSRSGD